MGSAGFALVNSDDSCVLVSAKSGAGEIPHEAGSQSADLHRRLIHFAEVRGHDVILIQGNVELRAHFAARSFRGGKEMPELLVASSLDLERHDFSSYRRT